MNYDHQAVKEGATHWSPADPNDGRAEAYWRPDWKGGYDCWAVTANAGGNKWQENNCELPSYAIALMPAWNGEGLPPAGTKCEAKTTRGWGSGTIIAHGLPPKENLAVWQEDGELIFWGVKEYFRPIRTPEQIASEEQARIVDEQLGQDILLYGTCFAVMNDDGTRTRIDPTKIVIRGRKFKT